MLRRMLCRNVTPNLDADIVDASARKHTTRVANIGLHSTSRDANSRAKSTHVYLAESTDTDVDVVAHNSSNKDTNVCPASTENMESLSDINPSATSKPTMDRLAKLAHLMASNDYSIELANTRLRSMPRRLGCTKRLADLKAAYFAEDSSKDGEVLMWYLKLLTLREMMISKPVNTILTTLLKILIGTTGTMVYYNANGQIVQNIQDFLSIILNVIIWRMAQFPLKLFDRFHHGWVFDLQNVSMIMLFLVFLRTHLTGSSQFVVLGSGV